MVLAASVFIALVAGLGLGWLMARTTSRRAMEDAARSHLGALTAQHTLLAETTRRLGDAQRELEQLRNAVEEARNASTAIREENAQLRAELGHQRQVVPQQLALLQQAEGQLKASFEALASTALRASTEEFLKLADQKLGNVQKEAIGQIDKRQVALDDLIKPIRDALTQVDQKLADGEKARIETSVALGSLIQHIGQGQDQLRGATMNLVRALRTPSVRGRWGEIQLRRVVEMAGMLPYCDFDEQPSLIAEQGRQRPDLVVKLPGGKTLVVDAKVPLEAYLDATDAQDDTVRDRRMVDHARQVRDHMSKLGAKSYWEQVQPSPEFVVMFLPGESFFQAALQHDPELIDYGVRCQVFPASPITLIALLQVVAQGWRHERLAQNAEEVRDLGKELYARVSKMTDYLDALRTRLDGTVKAFNDVVGSYETRVLVTARKFKELGATSGTEIDPMQPIDTVPRILHSANLLGLPDDVVDGETVHKES
ncbi:MAG TPA: DNA recombination protein RmuC [Vicinamibacterales bacterium]|nr:DNA recombination protein RmuC [Vicinamibacterales bacterium]